MKKGIIFAVISILAVLLIAFFSIILPKIVWINNAREYAPYLFPGSTWVCKDPKIEYSVPEGVGEDLAKTEIDGEAVYFELGIVNSYIEAIRYRGNGYATPDPDILFTGSISYSENKFVIKIDKESDKLFEGKYDVLEFERNDN